uniref:Putative secreted protein n=1 Tax=Ixodes scapularis TaxID=6945 RepID=A0A4D5S3S4_IXOSC
MRLRKCPYRVLVALQKSVIMIPFFFVFFFRVQACRSNELSQVSQIFNNKCFVEVLCVTLKLGCMPVSKWSFVSKMELFSATCLGVSV